MITRLLLILALIVIAAPLCAAQEEHWQKFTAPDKSCTLTFPIAPNQQDAGKDTESGRVATTLWLAKDSGTVYLLGITDYPIDVDATQELGLDRDNFLKAVKANLVSDHPTTLHGLTGLEFVGTSTEYTFRSRVFMIRRRVYQTVIGQPTANVDAAIADKFLNSFELADVAINR